MKRTSRPILRPVQRRFDGLRKRFFGGAVPGGFRKAARILLREFGGSFENALAHDVSGLEFDDRSRGNDHFLFRFLGIATDALLGEAGSKNTELPEFDALPVCQGIGDSVEGQLNDGKYILLDETGLFGDCNNEVALCEICHKESDARAFRSGWQ